MMQKFGRSYRLTIDPKDGGDLIVIGMPITVQFWTRRSAQASLNYLNIDIYNLSDFVRSRIFQDRFVTRNRTLTFEAGYGTLSTIFTGIIFEASSSREGVDIITRIECKDGGFDTATSMTFQTLEAGKTLKDVFAFLIGQFPNLEMGAVGNFDQQLQRPVVLNGNTYDLLRKYSDNQVYVDLNRVYVLKPNEVIEGDLPVINAATGILDTPRRADGWLTVTTLFEPRIIVGQAVALESYILPVYNGNYRVIGVNHQGIISEAVGGQCSSSFDLLVGNVAFEVIAVQEDEKNGG